MVPDIPPRPLSPNSVLANALLRSVDMIRPKVHATRPQRIVFVVGTQINGAPHLDTGIVQTSAFLLAKLALRETDTLYVMVKGGDWAFGCQLVDGALLALGTPPRDMPARVFTPMVLSASGGKLSKSLLRDHPDGPAHEGVEDWMLAATAWPGTVDNYVDALIWLVGGLLANPRHFYRSFTTTELGHLMATRPADLATRPRAREMPIYKRYFDLLASGAKTIEVRVAYPSNQRLATGGLIRFVCRGEECLTRITRIATYRSFDDLFTHEDPAKVNPTATAAEQLVNVRLIYPAEKEALGVMAIEVERC